MANFTGADVIGTADILKYQPDAFEFGISTTATETTNFLSQTTNDILRELRIKWWPVYKSNIYTDITVLNTAEMVDTKVDLDQFERAGVYLFLSRFYLPALSKFRPEADKDRFERMIEFYGNAYTKEFQSILEDGVNYDSDAGGSISASERESLHGYKRLSR
tara:strand:+ start:386 stop:871 length:486 start_codon:yes stop_codon:yes gene_type:complete